MKLSQPEKYWDRLFAPSSSLALITTIDPEGRINAAAFGTCTRVNHNPVYIAFTTQTNGDTATNLNRVGEFVVNLPAFDRDLLERTLTVGLPFERGVNELSKAGLTAMSAERVRPPRIAECGRHFECVLEWTKTWVGVGVRTMVCGRVIAASTDADLVDEKGYLRWERANGVHYCGAPYGPSFVSMREIMTVEYKYDGPEIEKNERMRALFEDR